MALARNRSEVIHLAGLQTTQADVARTERRVPLLVLDRVLAPACDDVVVGNIRAAALEELPYLFFAVVALLGIKPVMPITVEIPRAVAIHVNDAVALGTTRWIMERRNGNQRQRWIKIAQLVVAERPQILVLVGCKFDTEGLHDIVAGLKDGNGIQSE